MIQALVKNGVPYVVEMVPRFSINTLRVPELFSAFVDKLNNRFKGTAHYKALLDRLIDKPYAWFPREVGRDANSPYIFGGQAEVVRYWEGDKVSEKMWRQITKEYTKFWDWIDAQDRQKKRMLLNMFT